MALEDFTTYAEVDPNSRITKTATRVTWASLDRNETAYVYKDKGADFFSGDFTHLLTVCMTAASGSSVLQSWALTNAVSSLRAIYLASGSYLACQMFGYSGVQKSIQIVECNSGALYTDSYTITLNTVYYLKIVRDESVGTYGTLYCYIYSDVARTTLLDTLSLTLHTSKKDFRYIFAVDAWNSGETPHLQSGYTENLSLYKAEAGYAETYPSDAITRVTSLIHRYDRGIYTLEMGLGEVISDFGIPLPITTPQKATVKGEEPRIASAKMEAAIKEMQGLLADVKAQGYDYSKGIPQEYFTKKYGEAWAQSAGTPGRVEAMQQHWQATQPGVPLPPSLAPGTEKMEELNIQLGGKYVNGVLTPPSWFTGSATKWVQYIREKATGLTSLR